jgi:histidinol-phosphate aminotransferase
MPAITHLIRPDIAELEPYTPIVPPERIGERLGIAQEQIIKVDANENPYGPAPAVADALVASLGAMAIYPDPEHTRLRAALSDYTHQPPERILCGAGADELIDLLLRLMLEPGDAIIDCPPTFGMYSFDTAVCGGRVIQIWRQEDFSLDIPAIEQTVATHHPKILFLTSPNNPSGNLTTRAEIERLLALPLLVVVDEAYVEFTHNRHGVSELVGEHENVVVLRTFSKWAGLAGLRIGYGLFPESIATQLWKIKQPYNVNVAAEVAACTSLSHLDHLQKNIACIVSERARMEAALGTFPFFHVYPSDANFLLCRVTRGDARGVQHHLEQHGIIVRHYRKPGPQDCVRISIGTPEQNTRVLNALSAYTPQRCEGKA